MNCCVRKCARSITIKQMKVMRLKFWSHNLLERLSVNSGYNEGELAVCLQYRNCIRRRYLQGSSYTLDRKQYRKRSDKFINALIWLEVYATFRADRMSDSQTALLPYGTRRIRIYEQYHQENEKETQLKRSSFLLMWSKYLPNLKIKQVTVTKQKKEIKDNKTVISCLRKKAASKFSNKAVSDLDQFLQLPRAICDADGIPEKGQKSWATSVFKKIGLYKSHKNTKESEVDDAISDFLRHAPQQPGGSRYKKPTQTASTTVPDPATAQAGEYQAQTESD
ncbi:unnamed protein product [Mytilus edulis]|uniref:Uncharacterized protein n=1 Tax=Mytilus edulis TaxID=6550 RepID=A0A8S3VGA2_MYTED|nr:unnamed protein product [Mytilus edulis]